jgi:hypothetical protein
MLFIEIAAIICFFSAVFTEPKLVREPPAAVFNIMMGMMVACWGLVFLLSHR